MKRVHVLGEVPGDSDQYITLRCFSFAYFEIVRLRFMRYHLSQTIVN